MAATITDVTRWISTGEIETTGAATVNGDDENSNTKANDNTNGNKATDDATDDVKNQ